MESVRELRVGEKAHAGVFEHAVRPPEEVLVRLDDGSAIQVLEEDLRRFEPGTRVLVLGGTLVRISSP